MSDLPTTHDTPKPIALDSAALEAIELMFFAYRDFTDVADRILEDHDLGRAHHRALYFIGTNGGITVGHLLEILNITKQSLIDLEADILIKMGFDYNFPGPIQSLERFLRILKYDQNRTVYDMSYQICKF